MREKDKKMLQKLQQMEKQIAMFRNLLKNNKGRSSQPDRSDDTSSEGRVHNHRSDARGRSLRVRERPVKRRYYRTSSTSSAESERSSKRQRLDDDSSGRESVPDNHGDIPNEDEPAMVHPVTVEPAMAQPANVDPAMAQPANAESEMTQARNASEMVTNGAVLALSNEEVIEVFGKLLHEERGTAPGVLPELAVRWEEILQKGIPLDVISEMLTKYPPPDNCPRFDPPKLNQVLKAIMPEQVCERDDRITRRQLKISAALSAMGKALTTIAGDRNIPEWKSLVENISDASKILADLQHDESVIRRSLLMANIESSMKEPLKETEIGEFLFGTALEETVKNIRAMKTTAKDLKKAGNHSTVSKNFKAPQRQTRARRSSSVSPKGGVRKQHSSASKRPTRQDTRDKESNRTTSYNRGRSRR
ncbi:hypothetical protein DMENIID0001_127230 [Sergentomyia squamirostris]